MSGLRQAPSFTSLSSGERDTLRRKINQVLPTFLPAPFRETLAKAINAQITASIELRNQHQELGRIWQKLCDQMEEISQVQAFKKQMNKAEVQSYFNVLQHLYPGQDIYHTEEHSGEMRMDNPIQNQGARAVENFLINQFRAKAGSDHDIIQGDPLPLQNEVRSAEINEKDTLQILRSLQPSALSEEEMKLLSKALAQPIIDHTFLILGKDSLASLRQEIEQELFSSEELDKRNKNLYFQNAIGFGLEFSDVNRAAYEPLLANPAYERELNTLTKDLGLDAKILNDFNQQQHLSQPGMVNMLIGQGVRMLPEMHNKYRYEADQRGEAELNASTRKNILNVIRNKLGLEQNEELPPAFKPLTDLLTSNISVQQFREQIAVLEKTFPVLKDFAYLFSTAAEQKVIRELMHNLKLFDISGEEKYRDEYLKLLNTYSDVIAKVYMTSTINPLGSNDVGFSLDRDISKLLKSAEKSQVQIGSEKQAVDVFAHYKQALLLDKNKALAELELKSQDPKRSGEEMLKLKNLMVDAKTHEDLMTYYQKAIQGKPAQETAFVHQLMLHSACQHGFYEQRRFIAEHLAEVKRVLAIKRPLLADKSPQKLQMLDAIVTQAENELKQSRQARKSAIPSSRESISAPLIPSTIISQPLSTAVTDLKPEPSSDNTPKALSTPPVK